MIHLDLPSIGQFPIFGHTDFPLFLILSITYKWSPNCTLVGSPCDRREPEIFQECSVPEQNSDDIED